LTLISKTVRISGNLFVDVMADAIINKI